jgi:hypothetical protein
VQSTGSDTVAVERIEAIEQALGLTQALPFMSLRGIEVPSEFDGVAIWPTGTANWTQLRLEQILAAQEAGARFKCIVCLNSSRVCNTTSDRRHPLIARLPVGQESTEQELQHILMGDLEGYGTDLFRFAELPSTNETGKSLSLEQQLKHLQQSGQYDELIGGSDIYVPSTPNSLFVPLYVRRILEHNNVWFSQAGAFLMRQMPDFWWPTLQQVMTLPSGMIRLWVELLEAGCITT